MNDMNPIDSHILLINSMLTSLNQLIGLMKNRQTLNKPIHNTIKHIFIFISNVIGLIPEILYSKHDTKIIKEELFNTTKELILKWEKFPDNRNEFIDTWNKFNFWWEEFSKIYKQIQKEKTIELYMN